MKDLMRVEYSNFLKLPTVLKRNQEKDSEWFETFVRVNPVLISYYYPCTYGKDDKTATSLTIGGGTFIIAMAVEEVDKMMEEIDRGFSMKEENGY